MWRHAKIVGRISRQDYECGSVQRVQEEFKTRLCMLKHAKSGGRILKPDYEYGSVRRMQEEFQYQTLNVEACE